MEKQNLDNLAVGGHNVFHGADSVGRNLDMWKDFDKQLELDEGKNLGDLVKEVAETEGLSEEEVLRHLQAFSKIMEKSNLTPKTKTNKEKAKAKSKRKMAKKSKKKNR